ncbi:MAG: YegS/Rv2252/BmrU family lipid kinase [Propionibacteriaceae bacterium]|nr:YegS/Rv2252/BmrU family lipid kinase [Propionibacteriaceae bacterium]
MSFEYDGATLSLVVNPSAGHGKAKKQLPAVTTALLEMMPGVNLRLYQTSSYAEARLRCIGVVEAARELVEGRRPDSLLVMGGDGMMHLGLNACAGTQIPLGLIPAGSGNDFCRGLGIPAGANAAVDVITKGNIDSIDLMELTGKLANGAHTRFAGSILSSGYDARVNDRVNRMKFTLGSLSYAWAALAELSIFEPVNYRLLIDGEPLEQTAMFVCIGNAGFFGGGMQGCPNADVRDGLLDITIINPVSRATLLRLLPAMFTGGFVKDPAVQLLRAAEVVVDGDGLLAMADGENIGEVPITLRAVPNALRVYLP